MTGRSGIEEFSCHKSYYVLYYCNTPQLNLLPYPSLNLNIGPPKIETRSQMNRCMLSNVGLAEIKFYTIVNLLRFLQSHLYWIIARTITVLPVGARWPSGLERWTGDRMILGSNPATATLFRNFDNSVCPALPVSFGGDTKSCRFLLYGVYARGSQRSHQSALEMCNLSWTPHSSPEKDYSLNHSYGSPNMGCLECT